MVNGEHYTDKTAENAIHNVNIREYEKRKELKVWLNRSYKLQKKLERLIEKEVRTRSIKITPAYSSTPGGSSNTNGDNMSDMLIRIEEIQLKQKEIIEKLVKVRKEITIAIFTINNSNIREVVLMRHLRYSSFDRIGKKLSIPKTTVFRRYCKGIEDIANGTLK